MFVRATVAWLALLMLAMLNGAFREALLTPELGERPADILSTLLLSALIAGATWLLLPWMRPLAAREAWLIGALWLVLTVAFEFLGGHYLFREPWERLLAAYDVADGQLWVLVLLTTLLAPVVVRALRGSAR
jgi:hypothetical protein